MLPAIARSVGGAPAEERPDEPLALDRCRRRSPFRARGPRAAPGRTASRARRRSPLGSAARSAITRGHRVLSRLDGGARVVGARDRSLDRPGRALGSGRGRRARPRTAAARARRAARSRSMSTPSATPLTEETWRSVATFATVRRSTGFRSARKCGESSTSTSSSPGQRSSSSPSFESGVMVAARSGIGVLLRSTTGAAARPSARASP